MQQSTPVFQVVVEASRDANDIHFFTRQESFHFFQIGIAFMGGRIENRDISLSPQNIYGAVTKVQIKIEDHGTFNPTRSAQFFQGDGHVVEVAEPPGAVPGGMVTGRADESESGFGKPCLRRSNGTSGR